MSKYRNIKTEVNGIKFDSIKESERYRDLLILSYHGSIVHLTLQPKFQFEINGELLRNEDKKNGNKGDPVTYSADFSYMKNGERIIEDVKGFKTAVYKLKKALMLAVHGIRIYET